MNERRRERLSAMERGGAADRTSAEASLLARMAEWSWYPPMTGAEALWHDQRENWSTVA